MLQLKPGVVIRGNPYTNAILAAVQTVFRRHELLVTVTSGNDSLHGSNSYHYADRALDIRFWGVPEAIREVVAQEIRKELLSYYDVVVEADHYHIEADAKKERALS